MRSIDSSVELAEAVSPITLVNISPSRSPRLATNEINRPVRHALRSFVAKKTSNMVLESQGSLEIFSLHHLKSYIDECEDYFYLNADVIIADAGKNRIQNFLKGKFKVFFTNFFYWLIATYHVLHVCSISLIKKNYSARYELLKNAFFASCHTISCRGAWFYMTSQEAEVEVNALLPR